jgi:hypothetical protein
MEMVKEGYLEGLKQAIAVSFVFQQGDWLLNSVLDVCH